MPEGRQSKEFAYRDPSSLTFLKKSDRKNLRILRVDIKPLIRHRKLRERVVYVSFGSHGISSGLGRRSGLLFPESKVLEDLFYDILILNHADDFHGSGTFWAGKRINLIYLLDVVLDYIINNNIMSVGQWLGTILIVGSMIRVTQLRAQGNKPPGYQNASSKAPEVFSSINSKNSFS